MDLLYAVFPLKQLMCRVRPIKRRVLEYGRYGKLECLRIPTSMLAQITT